MARSLRNPGVILVISGVAVFVLTMIECFLGIAGFWHGVVGPQTEQKMIDLVYAQIGAFVILIIGGAGLAVWWEA